MRQEGSERANSGHALPFNITTDSAGEPFRTRPQCLCIPTQWRSHRGHAVFGPTPQQTCAPSPIPACRNISASRSRLPSHLYLPRRHPIMSLVFWCSWLPLASQGAIRGKATAGAAFTMFPPFHRLFAPYQMSQQLTLAQLGRPPPSPHLARPRYLHPRTHIHGRPCHHHTTGRASNVLGLELAPDGLEPDSALPRCPKA